MRTMAHRSRSDVLDRLHAVEDFLQTGQTDSLCGEINRNAVRTLTQVAKQLASTLRDQLGRFHDQSIDPDEALLPRGRRRLS